MSSYYWAKVDIDTLDDRKVAQLPDSLWRRYHECILLAKEHDEDGYLPLLSDMAWRLRITDETMAADLSRLSLSGLVELRNDGQGERWYLTGFVESQGAMSDAERMRRYRQSGRNRRDEHPVTVTEPHGQHDGYGAVTVRNTEEIREEKREEERENARARPQPQPAAGSPPSVVVVEHIPDRTPGGNGFHPPAEPPEPEPDPAAEERRQAIGAMANAITDVTGISARLNKAEVIPLAIELVDAGYSPSQLHRHYGKDAGPGGWNWYKDDWRGQTTEKRKGGPPRLKEIRETIVLATASVEAKTGKKLGAVERALAMFGNAPQTAPA